MPTTTTHSIAKAWSNWAVKFQHPSVLEAFRAQVDAYVQLAWVGFDFNDRVKTLQSAGQALAADASTCAIRAGNLELAIEMLEACRNLLFLSAASTWNAPLELKKAYPKLVSRLMTLGPEIRRMSSSYSKTSNTDLGSFTMPNDRKNHLAQQLRQLGIEWDQVISDVRAASGYEDFMRTLPFNRLAGVASDRLVVSVITSDEYDCTHALMMILGEPYVLELPLTSRDARRIFNQFKKILNLRFGRAGINDDSSDLDYETEEVRMIRLKDLQSDPASLMAHVLKDLWALVMDRVINFLKEKLGKKTESLPHILINATGFLSSLPLHAAGVYDSDGRSIDHQSVLDRVICSYTPSLSSLKPKPAYPNTSIKVLALGAGENLRHVEDEVKTVAKTFGAKGDVTSLVGSSIDLDTVKRLLSECQIAHFASHGLQDSSNPLNSRLLFHDQSELTLEELMKLYLPKAKLAVLFACETAQGDMKLTNEALHLVGVMLSIGFSGAIGTLWPMSDSDGIPVCEVFYKALLEGGGSEIDYSRASYALHEAVCAQRDAGVGLIRWASFAHFGQ
ncbi:hypothetical protein BDV93DRAFT_496736 [Ceratobasidium sp. AG-I]|nr:hypothetical protein BDV93DRAFT_496736 [Ceratobasidium sp. AG-I]